MRFLKAIAIIGFFGAFTALSFRVATAHADDCDLTPGDFGQITAIQNDPSLSYLDEVKQELAARKALIGKTITCAETDVQSLQTSLNAVATSTGSTTDLKNQLSGKLNDAANFYNNELTRLNGVGISGSETIAAETLAWRAGSYEPLEGEVNNFILWSENQSLFATAATRMQQTQQAVSFLEGASGNTDLQNAFSSAQASFADAESQNTAAQNALIQFLPPDQSLALIKQSLDSLSATYQNFFTVSSVITTLLPH